MNPPINLIENESTDQATSVGLDLDAPIVGCGREGVRAPILDHDQPRPLPDHLVSGEVVAHCHELLVIPVVDRLHHHRVRHGKVPVVQDKGLRVEG